MVNSATIFGHSIRALTDSSATSVSSSAVLSLGLSKVRNHAILEWKEEQKFLSKGKTVEIPIVTKDLSVKIDLRVTPFLHDVDMMSGIHLLQALNPLIDWWTPLLPKEVGINWPQVTKPLIDCSTSQTFSRVDVGIFVLPGSLLDQAQKSGTISVLQDVVARDVLKDIAI